MHKKYVMKEISLCGITIFLNALFCKRIGATVVLVCPFITRMLFFIFLMKNNIISIIWLKDIVHFEWVPVIPDYWESRI